MAQNYTDDCFAGSHAGQTDLQNMENNFACLKSSFSGDSAPSNPVAGMWWFDTDANILKIRNEANGAWISVFNFATNVLMLNLADGVLSADAAGRAKMADLFITNAKVNDIDGSKIADNSIASGKIQNNALTPSKLAPGASNLWQWSYDGATDLDASEAGIGIGGASNGTYKVWRRAYLYIPSGAKYVVLGVRASSLNYPANWRINVNGTAGSVAQPTYNAGINNAYGSSLDISSQAGAWRLCKVEISGSGGAPSIVAVAFTVTWYGA